MSGSKLLGPLPEFTTRKVSSGTELDDALESLLGDGGGKHERRKQRSTEDATKKLANDSDEDLQVTEADAKKLAESVDIDDMEASLFSSFSQGRKRRPRSKTTSHSRSSGKKQSYMEHEKSTSLAVGVKVKEPKQEEKQQKVALDDDDDLLDLLSDGDGDDLAVRKQTKPRIQLRTPSLEQDGKPITSVVEERPRSRHGSGRGSDDRGSDVVESSAEQKDIQIEVEMGHKQESSMALKDRKVESLNSSMFGDDLLSGMGLADSEGSKVNDLLGNVRKPAGEGSLTGDVEEEGYRFGGYSPSVASLEKPPSVMRRGSEVDSLTSRPSSAPSTSVKKSVRFADTVETSDRPSSSPAVGQVTRGAVRPRRKTSAGSEVSSSMQLWEEQSVSIDKYPAVKDPQDGSSSQEQPSEVTPWQQSKPSPEAPHKRWSSQGTIFAEHRQEPLRRGREQGEVELQERVRELEGQLQKEKEDCRQRQNVSEAAQRSLEEKYRALRDKSDGQEESHRKVEVELTTQNEELKLKLHRLELERDNLKQALQDARTRHEEETDAMRKSNEARLQSLEESFHRREARWHESESSRCQERLQQAERDAAVVLKRRLNALEASKTDEITRLQETHLTAIDDMRREHEGEKQQLRNLHIQEVSTLKATHSHTHMLSALTRQVEASSREVSQLQVRVDHAHSQGLEERELCVRTQEEHLKVLEDRLSRQQVENERERERLQSLTAKLEAHISQQSRQMEKERWQLQQEVSRLKARQSAVEEERGVALARIEEEKDHLQQAKEKFLSEQQDVLTQCYEEQRSLASERAEVSLLQKKAIAREQRESEKSIKSGAELEASLSHAREQSARVAAESAKVRLEVEQLTGERAALERDREKMEAFGLEVQRRAQEVEEMCQAAVIVRSEAEQSIHEVQRLREELEERSHELQTKMAGLLERETWIANEQLALARERREFQHDRLLTSSMRVPSVQLPEPFSVPVSSPSVKASPVPSPSVKASLSHLSLTRSLRQIAWEAEKDNEDLEEENRFLDSLQNNTQFFSSSSSLVAS